MYPFNVYSQQYMRVLVAPYPHQHLILSVFNFSHSDVVLIFLMAKKVEHLFMFTGHMDILHCEAAALSFLPYTVLW